MVNRMNRWNDNNPNMKPTYRPPAPPGGKFDHLFSTDWHSPVERRIDGDRVTEMVPGREWLRGRNRHTGNLADVNPMVPSERNRYPPSLPRGMMRDHLHDRNREWSLYDKANPGLATYVRVTRRRGNAEQERAIERNRAQVRRQEIAKEQIEAQRANELLQLRSSGINSLLIRAKQEDARLHLPEYARGPPAAIPKEDPRVSSLEKQLKVYETLTPVSHMQIDTTPQAGHNTQGREPGKLVQMEAAPAAVSERSTPLKATMRGGTWPVNFEYFRRPVSAPSKFKKSNIEVSL